MQINPSHQAPASAAPIVVSVQGESPARAREAANQLALEYGNYRDTVGLIMVVGETSAWLELEGVKVAVKFDSAAMQHRRKGGHNEMLGRAVGLKADRKPLIWDATGGLGRDAFVLADLGCEVTLCERVPVLAWLLDQAVQAAAVSGIDQVRGAAERISVLAGDSKTLRAPAGSVIYLDPMFPERKKAAAVKKEAVMLQHLADQVDDGESLWQWAWEQPVERIVVKRPLRAPILGHIRPAHTLKGKSVRFDVFTRRLERS
ncbi:MAG: class I SAM-dependent methyltransferase [Luminiphilus sp.]|nr:class I SAM-dependent methyltransferase [Luminiphilus sp.]